MLNLKGLNLEALVPNYAARQKLLAMCYVHVDDAINERAALYNALRDNAEDGEVLIVESGRDCDGVEYTGYTRLIEATTKAYWAEYNHVAEWADGPFRFTIAKPSHLRNVKRTSRDRVLEAYENGHAHSIASNY